MGLDQEKIKKRLSQIELDIDKMNQMIDDNLQLNDTHKTDTKKEDGIKDKESKPKAEELILESEKGLDLGNDETTEEKEEKGRVSSIREGLEKDNVDETTQTEIAVKQEKTSVEVKTTSIDIPNDIDASLPKKLDPKEDSEDVSNNDSWDETSEEEEDATVNNEEVAVAEQIVIKKEEKVTYTTIDNAKTKSDTSKIVLPKHTDASGSSPPKFDTEPIPVTDAGARIRSRSNNPFRVISVGNVASEKSSRKSSMESYRNTNRQSSMGETLADESSSTNGDKLQSKHEYLVTKCTTLTKEIEYLGRMLEEGNLNVNDTKKLKLALDKLQEYLDQKMKERYEVGVLLSRQLRKQIDRGENGQFWVGNK